VARREKQDARALREVADTRGDLGAGAPSLIALVGQVVLELHLLFRAQLIVGLVVVARRVLLGRALRIVRSASCGRAYDQQSGGASGEPAAALTVPLETLTLHRHPPVFHVLSSTFHGLDVRRAGFVYSEK
jgi:hypothetical protein